jgi:hypothetical protein
VSDLGRKILENIARTIESHPVLGHWPHMRAKADADYLRSLVPGVIVQGDTHHHADSSLEYRICRLDLMQGDVLVVRAASTVSMDWVKRIKEDVDRLVPGVRCLVLDGGTDLTVLTRQQLDDVSAGAGHPDGASS